MPLVLFESQRLAALRFDAALHRYLSEGVLYSESAAFAAPPAH